MIHIFFVQYFGSAILVLAGAAALMGHLEKAIWTNKEYGKKAMAAETSAKDLVGCWDAHETVIDEEIAAHHFVDG